MSDLRAVLVCTTASVGVVTAFARRGRAMGATRGTRLADIAEPPNLPQRSGSLGVQVLEDRDLGRVPVVDGGRLVGDRACGRAASAGGDEPPPRRLSSRCRRRARRRLRFGALPRQRGAVEDVALADTGSVTSSARSTATITAPGIRRARSEFDKTSRRSASVSRKRRVVSSAPSSSTPWMRSYSSARGRARRSISSFRRRRRRAGADVLQRSVARRRATCVSRRRRRIGVQEPLRQAHRQSTAAVARASTSSVEPPPTSSTTVWRRCRRRPGVRSASSSPEQARGGRSSTRSRRGTPRRSASRTALVAIRARAPSRR